MLYDDSAVYGIGSHNPAARDTAARVHRARSWRSGVSLLGLAVASAALLAGPVRGDTLDLTGQTVARVDFDHTSGSPYDIVQNGVLQLTNVGALTFAGTMRDNGGGGGVFSLQKFGNGTLTLTGSNSYSGETLLGGGTLKAGAANSFSALSILHSSGGAVDLAGFNQTVGGLNGSGLITNTSNNAVTLTLQTPGGVVGTLFGTRISETAGAIALIKSGAGEQDQSNASDYTGGTTLTGGTLAIGNSLSLGSGTITFNGPATLSLLNSGLLIGNRIVLTSNGNIQRFGDSSTISGVISGAGALAYVGAGSIAVTGANSYSGGTQIGGGVIAVGSNTAFGSGPVAITDVTQFDATANTLIANNLTLGGQLRIGMTGAGAALTLAGTITGAGGVALLPSSLGTVVLASANSYTGDTFLNSGTLQVGDNDAAGTGNIVVSTSATLQAGKAGLVTSNTVVLQNTLTVDTNGNAYTLAGTLKDLNAAGTLRKIGTGTLTLSGANYYTGGTSIEAGVVAISADNGLGASGGVLTLAGGGLEVTGTAAIGSSRAVVLNGPGGTIAVDDPSGALNLAGPVSGSGSLNVTGLGKLNLTGTNSFSGGTVVTAGILGVGAPGALGTGPLSLSNATLAAVADGLSFANAVTVNNSGIYTDVYNISLTGPVSGTNLTKFGSGTLTLSGDNTLSSGIFVAVGGLAVGSNTALGTNSLGLFGGTSLIAAADGVALGNIIEAVSGAPITIDTQAATLTLNGELNYNGPTGITLNKIGSGTLVVNGAWNGGSLEIDNVLAGTLQANAAVQTGQLNVASGATLSGNGSVSLPGNGATVTIADGGSLSPGTSVPGTLTVDNLNLSSNSTLNFKLGQAGVAGGASNDLVVVNGQLTLAGVLNVANGPGFTNGNYTLLTYGTITDNGLTLGTLPSGYTGKVVIVANPEAGGAVTLQALGNGRQYWDGNGALADHLVSGGSGTWNTGSFNWASADGASNSVWNNQQAVFGTVGGAVTVAGTQQFTQLQFDVDSYHLSGDGLVAASPDGVAAPEIRTAAATATIIDNVVSGSNGLLKSGAGTLTLNANNALTGAVTISGGRVNAGSNSALGSGGVELFDGTTLGAAATLALANQLTLDGIATIDSSGSAVALNGVIAGPGGLVIVDSGSPALAGLVTLSGVNTYLGGTTITNARASVAADSALGDVAAGLALSGGSLLTSASFSSARVVTLAGDSSVVPSSGTTLTLNGNIGGSGSLRQAGQGTLVLGGANTYAGGTFVNAGILSIGADANLGASGGGLSLLGATLQLTGDVVSQRPVTISAANTIDTGAFALTLNGPVTDTGSLTKTGTGTLVLNGANSSVAPTLLNQGTIKVGSNTAIGGGGLAMADQTELVARVSGLVLADAITTAGRGLVDAGTGTFTLNGVISGPGFIQQIGAGVLNLNGANSFHGLILANGTVAAGTNTAAGVGVIFLGSGATLAAGSSGLVLTNTVVTAGGIVDSRNSVFTLGGTVGGAGLLKAGLGNLVLNGSNTFAQLNVNAGTVTLGTDTAAGTGPILLASATTLAAGVTGLTVVNDVTASGAAAIDSGTGVFTLSGVISGPGSITKIDSGNLVLNGSNSFAGLNVNAGTVTLGTSTAVGSGTIALAGSTTLAAGVSGLSLANVVTTAAAATVDSSTGTLTLLGVVSGAGSITKQGSGNLVFDAANSFNGLTIGAGTVTLDANTSAGTGSIAFADGTTLAAGAAGLVLANTIATNGIDTVRSGGLLTLNGIVSGPGTLVTGDAGNLVLNGDNSFAALHLNLGTVTLGSATGGGSGTIAMLDGTTLAAGIDVLAIGNSVMTAGVGSLDSGGGSFTINGPVSGPGSITKLGLGNLVLNGDDSFNGLNITAGIVTVGSSTAAGSGVIALADGTTLAAGVTGLTLTNTVTSAGTAMIDSGDVVFTLAGPITGPGAITKLGLGNLVLQGVNGFAGLNVDAGTVTVGNSSAAGSGGITLASNTTLAAGADGILLANAVVTQGASIDTGAATLTLSGPVSGDGSLTKLGSGTLRLSGGNDYAGATTVSAGTLTVDGTNSGTGAIGVLAGATLTGSGSIAGIVTIADGATIAPGSSVGTLTTGGLVLGNAANLAYQLGQANVIGGPSNSLLQVNGDLTLGGKLSVTDSGGFGNGVYRLINYTGALTDNGLAVASLPASHAGVIQTVVPGTVSLLVTAPNTPIQYWDGADMLGNGQIDGGSGSWTATGSNWTSAAPSTINSSWAGGIAVFSNTAGTVTVGGTQAFEGLQFTTGGYVLTGGTLSASAGSFIATSGGTTTIASVLADGSITKQGAGTLALTGSNSFAALSIAAGGDTVSLGSNTAGGTGTIALADGTTLAAGASALQLANAISTAGVGTIDTGSTTLSLGGIISGPGSLTKVGSGTLTLANSANSFANLNVVAGTIRAGGNISPSPDNSFGIGTVLLANGTTLAGNGGVSNLANAIVVTGSAGIDSGDRPSQFQGPIGILRLSGDVSGTGSLTKISTGNLYLDGTNSFNGLTIAGGTVIANAASVGTGAIALADGTTLQGTGVYANALSTAGTGYLNITGTLNGIVSGPGSINTTGALVLGGVNSFNGLTISGGSVAIANNSAAGNGNITINGSTLRAGADGLMLANAVSLNGVGTVDTQGFGLTLNGPITGLGQTLAKTGSGTLILNGSNSYTGGTQLNAGAITVGTSTALGTQAIFAQAGTRLTAGVSGLVLNNTIFNSGALTIDSGTGALTLNGSIYGSGQIIKIGTGNLTLGANDGFNGLAITAGRVTATGFGAVGQGSIALADGTTLASGLAGLGISNAISTAGAGTIDTGVGLLTLYGPINGAGSITKIGAGNLVLTGNSSYAGPTTVTAGTVSLDGSSTGTGAVTVQSGAALAGNGSTAASVTIANGATIAPGNIIGNGVDNGVGTLTTGSLVLSSGATLAYQLGQANVIGGAFNDLLQVNGNLTLGGGLTVTDSGSFGSGVYRLINYTGALSDNGLAITSLPGMFAGQIQTAVPGAVNLLVTAPGALVQYWDGPDMAGNGKVDGGSGSWTAANANWTTAAPSTINTSWDSGIAVFGTASGTVAVTGTQAFQGLQFATPGYILTGGTLNASAGAFIATNGGTTTIGSTITGSGAVNKQGTGSLVLNGNNSFAALNIMGGSVLLGSNTAGGTGTIALNDGTTLAGAGGVVVGNAVTTAGLGTLDSGAGVFTLNGIVSGPGSIAKIGGGTLVLNGANSFTGLGVTAGSVTLGTSTAGGSGGIALADGTALIAGTSGLVLVNAVTSAGVGTIDSGGGVFTLGGTVGGPGSISKVGSGNLSLNGTNSFAGLSINMGSVTLGTSTAAGSAGITLGDGTALIAGVTGLVVANAVSTVGVGTVKTGSGVFTLNGPVSGPGSISKADSGMLVLNGGNSFNGLAINSGAVTVGSNTAGGSGTIALAGGTTLAAGSSGLVLANALSTAGAGTLDTGAGVFTLSGPITGPGSIAKAGLGILVLNGGNSFAGLNIGSGMVTVGSNTAAGTGNIALADATTLAAGVTGLALANTVTTAGNGTIDSGTGAFTLNGTVSGPGSIAKAGSGNLVLNGGNSFAGLRVNAGTVTAGSNTAAGTGTVALAGGATLAAGKGGLTLANAVTTAGVGTVNTNGFDLTLGGPISGPGSLVETGGGSLTVAGVGSYAGPTTVASGQLRVTGSLTASTVTLASGASLRGTGSVAGLVAVSGSTVAPSLGTTLGTLSVTGNAVFQPGSTFAVNVGATTADRLAVGGTATLAGALTLTQVVGPLAPFTSYTLLTATGGRTGIFGTVSYGNAVYNAAFTPTVSYTSTAVLLGLQAKSLPVNGLLTFDERNVDNAYNSAIANGYNPSSFAALFAPGLNLPDALNQLSGEVHSAERRVAMDDTRHVREAALDRLGAGLAANPGKDDSAATTEHDGRSYTLWARGVGSWGTNRSDGNGSSFNTSTGGAIVGVEMGFDGGKIGALFDYTTTTLDHYALGQSKVESTGGGIYAGYRQGHGFAAAAGAAVAGIKARSSRTITIPGLGQTLAGRSDGNTYQAFADVSYDLARGKGTTVEPFLRFAWVALDTAAFTETGGVAALTATRGAYTTDITTAGLRGAVALKGFTLKASAGAQHTGGDRSPAALLALAGDNSPASISAVPVDRWALAADVSGEFRLARNATFAVGYSGVNGNRTRDNGVRGTLTFGF